MTAPVLYAIGECMIELRQAGAGTMDYRFGGDTLNAAVYLARLLDPDVARVAYVSGLGTDAMSDEMVAAWRAEGIDTAAVLRLPERLPGIYLIETDGAGERRFHYWRRDAAARFWMDAPGAAGVLDALATAHAVYLSGISLAILAPAARTRLVEVLARCRANGGLVVFDNNYRPRLWEDAATARSAHAATLRHAGIALLTLDDEAALHGDASPDAAIARARTFGAAEIVVKRGAGSCLLWHDGHTIEVPAVAVARVVDTTAAGDSFGAAYVAARLAGATPEAAARAGHRLAAAVVQEPGAIIPRERMPVVAPRN